MNICVSTFILVFDFAKPLIECELQGLCDYLQENPEAYYRILRKKKQEELENAGIFSFLKVIL